ncbi:hypothetical protein AMJ52_08575 [candidate division TA06 bacterium DG_78]|uniref:Uncharacterized protein n=1 Tax=candidate division TA06 bacterium DG_78 TaxID=1703772 RepID=A0A0S7Y9P2_UNCT6|nr:MAG: hypothetical protein AMJ52_08575 [candidate division TA06 bacterium DG_78]
MMQLILFTVPFGIDPAQYQTLVVIPNYLLVLGALLLWLAFIVLGIIARRYEIVLAERTRWQFMIFAPTGILLFAVIQFLYCGIEGKMMLPKGGVDYIAYGLFFLSGVLSLVANVRFFKVTKGK